MKDKKVSIIIPCYNEEENITECINRIPEMPWEIEIIVVDDGSTDETAKVAKMIKKPNLKIFRYEQNRGKGYVLRYAFKWAQGDIIVILDADYTCPPAEVPAVLKPIFDGEADFVNGSRFIYAMENGAMKPSHVLGNKLSAFGISLIIGHKITDSLCGLKAFRRKILLGKLKEDSWPDFELLVKAKRNNMRIVEVPVHYKARRAGHSKMNEFKDTCAMFAMLLRLAITR